MKFQKIYLLYQEPLNFDDSAFFVKNSTFAQSNSIKVVLEIF